MLFNDTHVSHSVYIQIKVQRISYTTNQKSETQSHIKTYQIYAQEELY